jgi:hypothetical protein
MARVCTIQPKHPAKEVVHRYLREMVSRDKLCVPG